MAPDCPRFSPPPTATGSSATLAKWDWIGIVAKRRDRPYRTTRGTGEWRRIVNVWQLLDLSRTGAPATSTAVLSAASIRDTSKLAPRAPLSVCTRSFRQRPLGPYFWQGQRTVKVDRALTAKTVARHLSDTAGLMLVYGERGDVIHGHIPGSSRPPEISVDHAVWLSRRHGFLADHSAIAGKVRPGYQRVVGARVTRLAHCFCKYIRCCFF
jgi:hypothetical protein